MTKSRLGRGLSAIIPTDLRDGITEISTKKSIKFQNAKLVPINLIRPNPQHPKMPINPQNLDNLAESIFKHGVLTPLLVKRDKHHRYILLAGERRLRAAKLAEQEYVPVIIRDQITSPAQLELAMIENLQRDDLDPIETALIYQSLIERFSLTQAQLGEKISRGRATIANTIRLLKLPLFLQEELRAGKISAGHCKTLLTLGSQDLQKDALDKIYNEHLSVREAESLVKELTQKTPRKRQANNRKNTAISDISSKLKTPVHIEGNHKGRIIINYKSPEEFDRILTCLLNVEKK